MKRNYFVMLLVLLLVVSLPAWARDARQLSPMFVVCQPVGGVLMTNINAIALPSATNGSNLGPVFGDLQGAVAATILGGSMAAGFDVQHYWVTSSGDTINFKVAHLTPTAAGNTVAVQWGDYRSDISGGTGKFDGATGYLEYFGLADFTNLHLVLRYRGQVCYAQ
ncbi:MAG: hypothetical protein ABSH47_26285 [Bryobacteraceae bacterium]|jgi:hypothetical protein